MKAFGLELRKTSGINARSLYADVNRVLSESGIADGGVSAALQQQTVAHSLQKMMNPDGGSGYFNVCVVKSCASLCGIVIPRSRAEVYSSIHCMNWNEMLPDFRATIYAMLLDDFRAVLTAEL